MLKLENIHKSFGPVKVLTDINLQVEQAEVLGLVGENGAGKSTLMNILGGVFPPTAGSMHFAGSVYQPQSVRESQEKGIAFIHQELNLFPNLTVSENLFIHHMPRQEGILSFIISRKKMYQKALNLLHAVGLSINPNTLLGELTNAQQQLVEIAKALGAEPRLIMFDEPTTALSRHEAERLFELIAGLKSKNISVIYISHNLEDVLRVSDQIAILRDGELVSTGAKAQYSKSSMVKEMVGRDLEQYYPERNTIPAEEGCLQVSHLSSYDFADISFAVKKGEVLGFYGLIGAGRSALARAIWGLDKVLSGTVAWKGQVVAKLHPAGWIKRGVAFLTEDRRADGLLLSENIRKNIQIVALPNYAQPVSAWLNKQAIIRDAAEQAAATRIKFQDLETQEVNKLSGGNQQKVVLAKWLMTRPQLLILDEPTKGIDIGAKKEIYELINTLVQNGSSVILISSEIEELLGMCDRILVMRAGRLSGAFARGQLNRSTILEAALPDSSLNMEPK